MGTLHGLKSPTHLITDWRLLLPPKPVHRNRLAKALPPSVVGDTLHLDYRFKGRRAKKMIENLCTHKAWNQPNLQINRFCHLPTTASRTFSKVDFLETAEFAGLTLKLDTDPDGFSPREVRWDVTGLIT